MSTDTRLNVTPQFVLGVCLVLFGVLLTLDRMQLVDAEVSLRFWPVVLVALGAWIVAERRATGRAFPGYVMMAIGGLLLLNSFGLARVRFWDLFWPAIIVIVGARLIMHSPGRRRNGPADGPLLGDGGAMAGSTGRNGTISMLSLLGGSQRASNDNPFRGGDMTSIIGGVQLDLRQAVIEPGQQAVIDVCAILGGVEIWVPTGWTVVSEVVPVLGGVEDKRLPPVDGSRVSNGTAPRLVLRGAVVLGGLTLKS